MKSSFTVVFSPWALLSAIIILYLFISAITFNQIEEDAYIYFRIAANLADGYGYVFNPGDEKIEAGSSFIYQCILAIAYPFTRDITIFAKVLGISFACLALLLSYMVTRVFIKNPYLACMPPLLLLGSAPFYCWAQRGLETSLFLSVVLLCFWFCITPKLRRWWYLPALLLVLSRPEGIFLVLAMTPVAFMQREDDTWYKGILYFSAGFLFIEIVRFNYFYDLVPHAFYIKMRGSIDNGWSAFSSYFYRTGIWIIVLASLPAFFIKHVWQRQFVFLLTFLMVTVLWAFMGEDQKPHNRSLISALPFIYIFAAKGFDTYSHFLGKFKWVVAIPLLAVFTWQTFCSPSAKRFTKETPNPIQRHWQAIQNTELGLLDYWTAINAHQTTNTTAIRLANDLRDPLDINYQALVGKFIADNYPKGITIVYDQMGQTPWFAGRDKRFIDSFGLLNKSIGHMLFNERAEHKPILSLYKSGYDALTNLHSLDIDMSWNKKKAVDHIFDQQPELIIINNFVARNPSSIAASLGSDTRLSDRYRHALNINNFVIVYERIDLPSKSNYIHSHLLSINNIATKIHH